MNCETTREAIQARIDERATLPPLPPEAEEHVRACADCAAYAREIESVVAIVRSDPEEEPPAGFAGRVMGRLAAAGASAPIRTLRPLPLRLAAALAAVAVGGFVTWRAMYSPEGETSAGPEIARALPGETSDRLRRIESEEFSKSLPARGADRPVRLDGSLVDRDVSGKPLDKGDAPALGGKAQVGDEERRAAGEKLEDLLREKKAHDVARPAPEEKEAEPAETKLGIPTKGVPSPAPAAPGAPSSEFDLAAGVLIEQADGLRSLFALEAKAPPDACVSYAVQIATPEAQNQVEQVAWQYVLQNEASRKSEGFFPSGRLTIGAGAARPEPGLAAGGPAVLSLSLDTAQLGGFDDALRQIPGVAVFQGPSVERIEPAVEGKVRAAVGGEGEKQVEALQQVVDFVNQSRAQRAPPRSKDGTEAAGGGGGWKTVATAPQRPPSGAESPAASATAPASRPTAESAPAQALFPVRLYLLPPPESRPRR